MHKKPKISLLLFAFPLFVIFCGIFLAMFHGGSLFILPEEKQTEVVFRNNIKPFLKSGEITRGVFTASENFLGTISIRFNAFERINSDTLLFRLKEKGSSKWYSENSYMVDQFTGLPFFPFGFPPIISSKGKIYIVELESLRGTPKDSIGISIGKPSIQIGYYYPRSYLFKNVKIFLQFVVTKIVREFPFFPVIHTIILGEVAICILFFLKKQNIFSILISWAFLRLKKYTYYDKWNLRSSKIDVVKFIFLYILLFSLILGSIYLQEIGIIFFLFVMTICFLIQYMFRPSTKIFFVVVLILYGVSFFLTIVNRPQIAEVIGTIIYAILIISSAKLIREYNKEK